MIDPRIYIIVPETVQVKVKNGISVDSDATGIKPEYTNLSIAMEPGRLMAQVSHVTCKLQNYQTMYGAIDAPSLLDDITTIVLSVRNSKELIKVYYELADTYGVTYNRNLFSYSDYNPPLYMTNERVMTAVLVGPVVRESVDIAIGHLELYSK